MQLVQVPDDEAPAATLYVPAMQLEQTPDAVAPAVPENVPAIQLTHTDWTLASSTADQVPAAQFVHAEDPATLLYVLAIQLVQVEAAIAPVLPLNVPARQF